MKFISLFVGLAYAHMEMLTPMPRRSKNFRAAYTGDEIDYNMSAPLDEVEYTYPCRGYKPGPVSAEYTAGQDIPITLHGTANHNGGHCQISISYDNVNYIVIKTIYGDCMVDTLSYSAHLPENAPAGKAILAWTWINRSGNREFYMNCADVQIKGQDNVCLTGKKILIANLENTPIFPEMFANDYGKELFDAQPVVSACGKGSAPSYPTAPTYSTPEVPTPVTSSKQSEVVSTISSSSQINIITSSQAVPTSSQINIITSSQVIVPTSSQVNVPVTTNSQVVVTSSTQLPSSSEIAQPSKKPGHCRPRPTSSISIVPTSSSVPSSSAVLTSAAPSSSVVTTSAASSSTMAPTSAAPSSTMAPTSAAPSSTMVPTSAAPSSTMVPTSAAPSSTMAPSSSSSHKPTKCSHKSTATAPSVSYPASSQMPAPSSSFLYPTSSQLVSQSSHMPSSSLAYPTSMQPSYPTANPGSKDCVDNTMKCMGPHAIAKCFMKTQYIHACPLGTTCQYLAGYDRCV